MGSGSLKGRRYLGSTQLPTQGSRHSSVHPGGLCMPWKHGLDPLLIHPSPAPAYCKGTYAQGLGVKAAPWIISDRLLMPRVVWEVRSTEISRFSGKFFFAVTQGGESSIPRLRQLLKGLVQNGLISVVCLVSDRGQQHPRKQRLGPKWKVLGFEMKNPWKGCQEGCIFINWILICNTLWAMFLKEKRHLKMI